MFRVLARHLHGTSVARASSNNNRRIVLSLDESCFVAYHPEKEHPYELTKPLPKEQLDDQSILKINSKNMITKAPNLEQLQALTYTPGRYWHEYLGRDKRQKYQDSFNDNEDRKGVTS